MDSSPFPSKRGSEEGESGATNIRASSSTSGVDVFLKLLKELIYEVVGYLGSTDIASLRLASRAFTHLPISLWLRLVIEEMPWLYEAWSNAVTPYPWVTKDGVEQVEREEAQRKASREYSLSLHSRADVIRQDMPDIFREWWADHSGFK